MANIFTKHPKEVGESYLQHLLGIYLDSSCSQNFSEEKKFPRAYLAYYTQSINMYNFSEASNFFV